MTRRTCPACGVPFDPDLGPCFECEVRAVEERIERERARRLGAPPPEAEPHHGPTLAYKMLLASRPAWMLGAACAGVDPAELHPPSWQRRPPAIERWCEGCPVAAECLDHALAHAEDSGVWGGLTEKERHQLRKERAA